eukprot:CAMPEP_0198723216 /NCGR_PEP_ID=MMETSP1475-20131203/763_1 /TAXON_ID= ORGANISM="Unidentified sp., Strain CCMP1999" /NCGR_SAMPLE_ID=MMETSP1475 /ASSEMBLY_ACC=CAM_ASM_001111 /LENGTH=329 /DNA_ID=CAMNT_0044484269 /DNA_START=156 /DNA_END=1142 /DNA_ORIENTATION=+
MLRRVLVRAAIWTETLWTAAWSRLSFAKSRSTRNGQPWVEWAKTDHGEVRCCRVGRETGTAAELVFVMDGPNCLDLWHNRVMQRPEAFEGYSLLAYEPPGVGQSVPSMRYDYSIKAQVEVLAQVIDHLIPPGRAFVLCAGCSHVLVCMHYAQTSAAPAATGRLPQAMALWQCGSPREELKWMFRLVRRTPMLVPLVGQLTNALVRISLIQKWYSKAVFDTTMANEFSQLVCSSQKRGGLFAFASLVQGMSLHLDPDTVLETSVPIIFFWGTQDPSHRRTQKESVLQYTSKSVRSRVVMLDACGHFPELERTEHFFQTLLDFLNDRRDPC